MSQLATHPIRVLVLGDTSEAIDAIASVLRQEPGVTVTTSRVGFGAGVRAIQQSEPDIALLLADSLLGTDPLVTIEELGTTGMRTAVVVLSACQQHASREYILAGARDCIPPPYERQSLVASLRQVNAIETRRRERMDARSRTAERQRACRIVAVHGAKGGVGSTTIAVNLAVALRKLTNERVALVDASLQLGDVGVALNLHGSATILDLLMNIHELDMELLDRVLATHSSGVRVLLGAPDLEHADEVNAEQMRRIVTALSTGFEFIVADTAATLDAVGLSVLDLAHRVVLVTTPELPALKNAGRFLQLAGRLGYPREKINLVVNRAGSRDAVSLAEIEKSLGIRSLASIPSAGGVFVKAANRGEDVIASRARGVSEGIYALARQLAAKAGEAGVRQAGRGRLFGLLRRREEGQEQPKAPTPLGSVPSR